MNARVTVQVTLCQDFVVSTKCANVLMYAQALVWLKHTAREITPSYKTVHFSIASDNCLPHHRRTESS